MSMPPSPNSQANNFEPHAVQETHIVPNEPAGGQPIAAPATSRTPRIHVIRACWALLMIVALGVTFFATAPTKPESSLSWDFLTATAKSSRDLNEANAQGAPQQTVVAGWHTADLLEIQILQASLLEEYAAYDAQISLRNGTLIALLGLTVAGEFLLCSLAARSKPLK